MVKLPHHQANPKSFLLQFSITSITDDIRGLKPSNYTYMVLNVKEMELRQEEWQRWSSAAFLWRACGIFVSMFMSTFTPSPLK